MPSRKRWGAGEFEKQMFLEVVAVRAYNRANSLHHKGGGLNNAFGGIMMRRAERLLIFGYMALGFLGGCSQQGYVRTVEQVCIADASRVAVMGAAEDVLAKMHFDIEKFDVDMGYVRTRPLSGAQSFEFWRSDNVGAFNDSEASLQSIRRSAELNLSDREGQVCINCAVRVERLSIPERQVSSRSMQRFELSPEQSRDMAWIDLGRDEQLETEILSRIKNKLTSEKDGK